MKDRSKIIFGNEISKRVYKKALKSKTKNIKKFGDDTAADYKICLKKNPVIGDSLFVSDVLLNDEKSEEKFDIEKGVIVGNIRMGFGHYRISMAMASAAKALGYKPYWMDLNGYPQTTCTKLISSQNKLYSLGSRLSKNPIFNKIVWEPLNYEGFRKLSYNAVDQKNAELMAPVYKNVPKDIPVVGTHVWPAQAAVHAGMKYVVNAIPDNWPMALHLAEGSIHTVQFRNSYMGYRILNGFNKNKVCNSMPKDSLVYTGHYIDHELVSNIERDCEQRISRKKNDKPMRFLLTIGGAGAQQEIFIAIIKELLPKVREKKVTLLVNVGDYENVWQSILREIPHMRGVIVEHFNDWNKTVEFSEQLLDENREIFGIHSFCHKNIFEAVYCTNLLMRGTDVLITKPSELAFYPVPKLFIRRVGKHEMWGAIHSSEVGDGTLECRDIPHTIQMINLFLEDEQLLIDMCENIKMNKKIGLYDGAYNVIKLAMGMKQ